MEATIFINRLNEGNYQTVGLGSLYLQGEHIMTFATLERPNLHNRRNVSSIPDGVYKAEKILRASNGNKAIWLDEEKTKPRTAILIHSGNYNTHTQGCILIGVDFSDINHDGVYDVTSSNITVDDLYDAIPDDYSIKVVIRKMKV